MDKELILAIDPSGNFNEGKGTTGWALLTEDCIVITCGQVLASEYKTKFDYWDTILNLVKHFNASYIVVEDFLLYEDKARVQINSRFETPKLIGLLEYYCNEHHINYYLQRAAEVKKRWNDDILVNKGFIQKNNNHYYAGGVMISEHIRDAIRHGVHFITYKMEKYKNEQII